MAVISVGLGDFKRKTPAFLEQVTAGEVLVLRMGRPRGKGVPVAVLISYPEALRLGLVLAEEERGEENGDG